MYEIKVYKIVNDFDDKIYVGSTSQTLSKRFSEHKQSFYRYEEDNSKKFIRAYTLFSEHSIDNCHIVLINSYIVNCREEQLKHERFHYDELKAFVVNHAKPICLSKEEKRNDHNICNVKYRKEHRTQSHDRYITNKDKLREKASTVWFCLCGAHCQIFKKARHKRTMKHITFMNRLCSDNMDESFEALNELHARNTKNKIMATISI